MTTTRTERGAKVSLWTGSTIDSELKLDQLCTGFQTQKQIEAPTGTWSVDLFPPEVVSSPNRRAGDIRHISELYSMIRPNQTVSIGWEERGGIMAGLVDGVDEIIQPSGTQVKHGLRLYGKDFGKSLVADNIVFGMVNQATVATIQAEIEAVYGANHPLLRQFLGVYGPNGRTGEPTFKGSTVEDAARWILENSATIQIPLMDDVIGGGNLADYMNLNIQDWADAVLYSDALKKQSGNIWNALRSILDLDFWEIRVDTVPDSLPVIELVIRPKPFDEDGLDFADVTGDMPITWESLTTRLGPYDATVPIIGQEGRPLEHWEIELHEVLAARLGISDRDAYSYYLATSKHSMLGSPSMFERGLAFPLIDMHTGARYGTRSYNASLNLIANDRAAEIDSGNLDVGTVASEVRNARNRLFNWHRMNPWFEGGTVQVKGRDRFRVGDPVFLPWRMARGGILGEKGMRYYCTGVNQSWSFGRPFTSTLQLSRGHNSSVITQFKLDVLAKAKFPNLTGYVDV